MNFDYHIHTQYSDGQMTMDEILERAITMKLASFGISDHFETGAVNSVTIPNTKYSTRYTEIKKKAERYGISVFLGAETGIGESSLLIPDNMPTTDYLIASLHRLPKEDDERLYWMKYLKWIAEAVSRGGFHIIGHIEGYLPLLAGTGSFDGNRKKEKEIAQRYFSFEYFRDLAALMKIKGIALEIHEMSESPRIEVVKLMLNEGVKLSYGTDAHAKEQLSKRDFISRIVQQLHLVKEDFIDWRL
jgi:histidinol phosphatase-like PHP family hydrolase